MKKALVLLSLSTLMLACATTSNNTSKTYSHSSKPTSSKELMGNKPKMLEKPSATLSPPRVSTSDCPKQASRMEGKNWESIMSAANACVKLGAWDRVEALGELLLKQEPFRPWGAYFLSLSADARQENERAMWMVELALKKNDSHGVLHFQKARILLKEEQYLEGMDELKKAIKMDPTLVDAYYYLGQVYLRDQDWKSAIENFEMVIKNRSDPIAWAGLGEAYFHTGNTDAALSAYKSARRYQKELKNAGIAPEEIEKRINNLEAQARVPSQAPSKKK